MHLRRARFAFSLIELLIVVALVASLVGVAVPMFQANIVESRLAKARSDLDTIRDAILRHDAHEKPLGGTNLEPLHGIYLQDVPKDPWGNPYYADLDVGVLLSFGSDGHAGGTGEDADIVLHFRADLQIARVDYIGPFGIPTTDNKIKVHWCKPYRLVATDPLPDLVLVIDGIRSVCIPMSGGTPFIDKRTGGGGAVPSDVSAFTWGGTQWAYSTTDSDPSSGLMILNCAQGANLSTAGDNTVRVTPHAALNVKWSVLATDPTSSSSVVQEKPAKGGPLDPTVFGADTIAPRGAIPADMVGDENRGVLFQRE